MDGRASFRGGRFGSIGVSDEEAEAASPAPITGAGLDDGLPLQEAAAAAVGLLRGGAGGEEIDRPSTVGGGARKDGRAGFLPDVRLDITEKIPTFISLSRSFFHHLTPKTLMRMRLRERDSRDKTVRRDGKGIEEIADVAVVKWMGGFWFPHSSFCTSTLHEFLIVLSVVIEGKGKGREGEREVTLLS